MSQTPFAEFMGCRRAGGARTAAELVRRFEPAIRTGVGRRGGGNRG
jgi:hypothetical protein